ncbi:MAG: class I SAM-dependent methyltransferase [Chthoniobacterales bacterium]|nr:class I SAM-dependent methyltransferase [Chthoniobacterales bacterium]
MTAAAPIRHLPYAIDESKDRNHFFENHWKRVALELLQRHAGDIRGWSLLDYGCGRGETMEYAANLGMVPSGLDTDSECVRLAARFGQADLLDPSDPQGSVGKDTFDVVACFHVLEHVDNPKETLRALARGARRYVLTAVPNLQKIPNLRKPRATPAPTNEGHLQSWDHAHFRNLAEMHCGLRLVSWGFDATQVPVLSELVNRTLGPRAAIKLETGVFRRMFPYWGISVIALLEPVHH